MNVLFINTSNSKGGAARVALDLKSEFEKREKKTSFFSANGNNPKSNFFLVPKLGKLSRILARITRSDINFYPSDRIIDSDQFNKADIIHCHNLHGNFFKLKTLEKINGKKPIVWTLHDMWPVTAKCPYSYQDLPKKNGFYPCPENTFFSTIFEKEKNSIYKKINPVLIVPSLWLKEKIERSVLKDKRIVHIPNGIDTNVFIPQDKIEARKSLGLPLDKKIVLFVAAGGNADPRKGWKYVEKVKQLFIHDSSILFVSIGGNNFVADPPTLSLYYSASDIFLFTSIRENFPLVVLEALACGLPVVSFDVGGVKEALVHMENGYVASYCQEQDLVRGIDHIFSLSEEEYANMSKKNRDRAVSLFSKEKMAESYLNLFSSILKK